MTGTNGRGRMCVSPVVAFIWITILCFYKTINESYIINHYTSNVYIYVAKTCISFVILINLLWDFLSYTIGWCFIHVICCFNAWGFVFGWPFRFAAHYGNHWRKCSNKWHTCGWGKATKGFPVKARNAQVKGFVCACNTRRSAQTSGSKATC